MAIINFLALFRAALTGNQTESKALVFYRASFIDFTEIWLLQVFGGTT